MCKKGLFTERRCASPWWSSSGGEQYMPVLSLQYSVVSFLIHNNATAPAERNVEAKQNTSCAENI